MNVEMFTAPAFLLYLDPATGSLLFSLMLGSAAAAFFVMKGLLHQGRSRLLKIFGRHEDASDTEQALVLYSEGRQYVGTFRPILQELARRNASCLYLSSDPEDPLLSFGSGSIQTKHIGKSYAAWAYLNTLRADIVLMTTPGLDVLQIKRSKHVRHYAHVIHAPTDKAFNRPYSFDYFDSVFICGKHQEQTIRTLEAIRNSKPKQLILAGCVYYDELAAAFQQEPFCPQRGEGALHVLVAPTWGKNGLLARYGLRVLRPLIEAGFLVTVRPHPQSRTAEADLVASLQEETKACPNVRWNDDASPLAAMRDADILVSDISGVIFDYCFLTERPVVTLDFQPEKRGFEASDLPYEPWELRVLDLVGRKIGEADFDDLPRILQQEAGDSSRRGQIRELREEFVANFGCAAGPTVAELMMAISKPMENRPGPDPAGLN
jgi:Putative glycosyl/glycerophosphate transferases involved in teichoic acid biosynthesis TagF/TagB/EpsJ/RodC